MSVSAWQTRSKIKIEKDSLQGIADLWGCENTVEALKEEFKDNDFEPTFNKKGHITGLMFTRESAHEEEWTLETLAPFIENKGYIEIGYENDSAVLEDDEWFGIRFEFNFGEMDSKEYIFREINGKISKKKIPGPKIIDGVHVGGDIPGPVPNSVRKASLEICKQNFTPRSFIEQIMIDGFMGFTTDQVRPKHAKFHAMFYQDDEVVLVTSCSFDQTDFMFGPCLFRSKERPGADAIDAVLQQKSFSMQRLPPDGDGMVKWVWKHDGFNMEITYELDGATAFDMIRPGPYDD